MARVIFINRYFFPDHSATSQMVSDLAFALAEAGRKVSVVTSQQCYNDATAGLPREETVKGVDIHRVPATTFGRSGLCGRGLDYLSFYRGAHRALHRIVQTGDILVAKTDPPLISLVAMQVAAKKKAHLVNWLQDLYPEIAVAIGVPLLRGPTCRVLASLRDRSLRTAAANVAIGTRMTDCVLARGIDADTVHTIPNWSDDEAIAPIAHQQNVLRQAWGLTDKFVVGYSGNLGRAHEFRTVLNASERLRDHPTVRFLMIGGGHYLDELVRCVKERGLADLWCFQPYQPREALNQSLCVPDLHWISLRPELEGLIMPSKFYGIAAAGRAILAITASDGDIARLVLQHACGEVIAPRDATGLAQSLTRLAADPDRTAAMGRRARSMLETLFTRRQAFAQWFDLLTRIEIHARDSRTLCRTGGSSNAGDA